MKHLLSVVALLGLLPACTGTAARDEVLMPAMARAWTGVRADVESGTHLLGEAERAQVLDTVGAVTAALDAGDRGALLPLSWSRLHLVAVRGINQRVTDGEVGVGVAASLHERLAQFGRSWALATAR